MKKITFKNLIFSIFLASTLILLPGCGGGGGGSASGGGYGYIAVNPSNNSNNNNSDNNNSDNNNSDNNNSDNNNSDNNNSDNNNSDNNNSDNNNSNDIPVADNLKIISVSSSYQKSTKKIPMNLGQAWEIDTSMAKSDNSINVNPTSGEGNGEFIEIEIPENTTDNIKNITVPITNTEKTTQIATISITQQYKKEKAWLFVNYFACDNNLANFQLDSLNAIEKVGSDENTHIIAYFDMGDRANLNYGNKYANIITEEEWPGGAREFYLMSDNTDKITSPVIKYYETLDTNSANPLTVSEFILRTIEQYPAEKICINIINHGAAYGGIITDETNDENANTHSTLTAIQYAIQQAYEQTGKKIDLLILDACVMANFETAYQLKDYVQYIIASEEETLVTVLDGLNGSIDYQGFLTETASSSVLSTEIKKIQRKLKSKIASSYDGLSLAKAILKSNKTRRDQFLSCEYYFTNYNTCSIINCSKIDDLKNSISAFAKYVKSEEATDADKEAVRKATENAIIDYAKDSDIRDSYENIKDYYGLIDEDSQKYIIYKPLGEIYSPSYIYKTIEDETEGETSYTFSVSNYSITDLGLLMQKIFAPELIYETVPNDISSASDKLKQKAENVYKSLKEVIPEDYYYTTEKISCVGEYLGKKGNNRWYYPFAYHKYSNGLSIGWFAYNTNDPILNNLTMAYTQQPFEQLVEDNKNKYTGYYLLQFYKDCPEWIEMQESLYQ